MNRNGVTREMLPLGTLTMATANQVKRPMRKTPSSQEDLDDDNVQEPRAVQAISLVSLDTKF